MCVPSSKPQSSSAAYRCYLLLSRFEYIDRRTCPGMPCAGPLRSENCRIMCGDVDFRLIHGSLHRPESTSRSTSRSVQPFCTSHGRDRQTDRQTDHATPSVAIGRIASAAVRHNTIFWDTSLTCYTLWFVLEFFYGRPMYM